MCPAAEGGGASGKKPRFLPEAHWAGQEPGSSYCLPELRPCRPADNNLTRLNHFTSRYSPSVALPTLNPCRYLHESKARFPVGWLSPFRCRIFTC